MGGGGGGGGGGEAEWREGEGRGSRLRTLICICSPVDVSTRSSVWVCTDMYNQSSEMNSSSMQTEATTVITPPESVRLKKSCATPAEYLSCTTHPQER